jgi:hypothetical protein
MNERIKELKLQAGIQDNPDQEGLDLFADLIIRDIHKFVDDRDTAQILSRGILKMYGMEE